MPKSLTVAERHASRDFLVRLRRLRDAMKPLRIPVHDVIRQPEGTVNCWLSGQRTPQPEKIEAVRAALNAKADVLSSILCGISVFFEPKPAAPTKKACTRKA